jgi:hypothetical protein
VNKDEFMREIGKELDKVSETERADIMYDYEEHFMIGKENGKTEEEICLELGSPKEIANNYLLNYTNENIQDDTKEEKEKNSSLVSGYNRRKVILGSGVIIAVLLLFVAGFGELARYNKSSIFINGDKVETGGIRIDSSGIHGGGISIDSNEVKVPGASVDSNGVKVPGVRVDSNGVKAPGVSIDNNGVKVDLPGVNINIKN